MEKNFISIDQKIVSELEKLESIKYFSLYLYSKKKTQFEPSDVIYYHEYIKSLRKYTLNTIYHYIVVIRAYCKVHFTKYPNPYLEAQFLSVFRLIKANRPYTTLKREDIFFKPELDKLLSMANKKAKGFLLGLWFSLCRIQEACDIEIKNIKVIDPHLTEILIPHGKNNRPRYTIIPTDIYLEIVHIFDSKKYLFESAPYRKYHTHTIEGHLRKIGGRFGKRLTPHRIRHSAITFLIENKIDLSIVSLLAGTTVAVLLKTYNHPYLDKQGILDLLRTDLANPFNKRTTPNGQQTTSNALSK